MDKERLMRIMEHCSTTEDCSRCEYEQDCYGGNRMPGTPLIRDAMDLIKVNGTGSQGLQIVWEETTLEEAARLDWVLATRPDGKRRPDVMRVNWLDTDRACVSWVGVKPIIENRNEMEQNYRLWRVAYDGTGENCAGAAGVQRD